MCRWDDCARTSDSLQLPCDWKVDQAGVDQWWDTVRGFQTDEVPSQAEWGQRKGWRKRASGCSDPKT